MSSAKHQYLLQLPGALQVLLELPKPLFEDPAACLLLGAYLPGVELLDVSCKKSKGLVTIALRQSSKPRLSVSKNGNNYTFFAESTDDALMDLIFLTYGVARQKWLKQGLYSVHAACLEDKQQRLSLVVGHSGVGKTAVTLSSLARGNKVFSGNRTLVKIVSKGSGGSTDGISGESTSTIIAIAGTRTITTKAEDLARHLPEALEDEEVGYQGRSAFSLSKRFYADHAPQAVTQITLPRLNDGAEKSKQLSALSALHKLYPFFLDAVNADIVLAGGRIVFAGTPPSGVSKRLASALSQALANLPVWELEGSLPFINHTLEEL